MPAAASASSSAAGAPAKPRIPWDGDSAFPGGKTSIAVLLEWLSAPGNGDRWRFGGVRVGGSGSALEPHFSKIELAREVVGVMATHGITHRLARDVRWKINALVRSHATAARFLEQFERQKRALLRDAPDVAHSRRAIESSEPRALTHVHALCPYFDVLDPILKGDRAPSPQGNRKKAARRRRLGDDEHDDNDDNDNDDNDDDNDGDGDDASTSPDHTLIDGLLGLDAGRQEQRPSTGARKRRLETRSHDDSDDDVDDEDERQIDRARRRAHDDAEAQFAKRRRALQLESLELDVQIKKRQLEREKLLVSKELLLVRAQLRTSGYAQDDIDARFPMRH